MFSDIPSRINSLWHLRMKNGIIWCFRHEYTFNNLSHAFIYFHPRSLWINSFVCVVSCFWRRVDIWPYGFVHFSAFWLVGWGGWGDVNVLWTCTHHGCSVATRSRFACCADVNVSWTCTDALLLRAHALLAPPMLTFLELAHTTDALLRCWPAMCRHQKFSC